MVGAVLHRAFDNLLHWSWITRAVPEQNIIWCPSYGSDLWQNYFSSMLPRNHDTPPALLPGDKILAINGYPVSAFNGFPGITNYLRQSTNLFLVAARSHTAAIQALTGHLDQHCTAENVSSALQLFYLSDLIVYLQYVILSSCLKFACCHQAYQLFQQIASDTSGFPLPASSSITSTVKARTPGWERNDMLIPSTYLPAVTVDQQKLVKVVTPSRADVTKSSSQDVRSPLSLFQRPEHATTAARQTNKTTMPSLLSSKEKNEAALINSNRKTTASPELQHLNLLFRAKNSPEGTLQVPLPFVDNLEDEPEDGTRDNQFLVEIDTSNFRDWLKDRKRKWRNSKWTSVKRARPEASLTPSPQCLSTVWTNPMFHGGSEIDLGNPTIAIATTSTPNDNDTRNHLPYIDNNFFDPYDGSRRRQYLVDVNSSNFSYWLWDRKQKWKSKWKRRGRIIPSSTTKLDNLCSHLMPASWTNPMFCDNLSTNNESGKKPAPVPYADNYLFDLEDGTRSGQFIVPVSKSNLSEWLSSRRKKWRSVYKVYKIESDENSDEDFGERLDSAVRYDFWVGRFNSFESWLTASLGKWKISYSWNSRKRKRIQQQCEAVVHFPNSHDPKRAKTQFKKWLKVRKNQWRVLRRKRQRRLQEGVGDSERMLDQQEPTHMAATALAARPCNTHADPVSDDFMHIDALLEEEERKEEERKERKAIDISFLFYPSMGCPDDVCAHCLRYLEQSEHAKLLCISKVMAEGLKKRAEMWQQLCPSHWTLPRRPRKPWHELYLSKLQMEMNQARKQNDDLISKVADILLKGDQLKVVQKLVDAAEKKFSFDVDYCSGVVCERNSILNLAVINQRHKIVRWLVEVKHADIETSDRGYFTPVSARLSSLLSFFCVSTLRFRVDALKANPLVGSLLLWQLINAAWAGNKMLVRYLLQKGADRNKLGTGHYTEALAPSDFEGLTAEAWARKKGHLDIAELIRIGL
jgi:hypothetical protein